MSPLHLLDCNPTILNGSLVSWIGRCSKLVVGKRDVITVLRNAIALFILAIGSSPEADTFGNEKVLYKIVNVVKRNNTVEQLLITIVDIE
ncbi:hypothetical protein Tco_1052816 [Tanacetum coccineum]